MSEQAHAGTTRLYLWVWGWLVALTGVEVLLAYLQFNLVLMLTMLMGFSIIKAALIVAYFMHLRFERLSLFLTLIPILTLCFILILLFFFPDSLRVHELGPR